MTALYPLRFHPVFKDYPWGGRALAERLGRAIPDGIVAESWEIAAHPHGTTVVAEGPLAGRSLLEIQRTAGEELVGSRNRAALGADRFPLLIKLLDASRWLSVQVHPDDAYAMKRHGDRGKTEMWVVLAAEPGAELIFGFRPGIDRASFAAALRAGRVEETLHRIPAAAGDAFFVPPGAIHALGPGLLLAEIQQSSDLTYRIYDWDRPGNDGLPRRLHTAEALEVLDFDFVEPRPAAPRATSVGGLAAEELARCPYFATERIELPAGVEIAGRLDGDSFEIWGALEGAAEIRWQAGVAAVEAVGWLLLPASLGDFAVRSRAGGRLLRIVTPG